MKILSKMKPLDRTIKNSYHASFILDRILPDMLQSENPRYEKLNKYYNIKSISDLNDYYNKVIDLILEYKQFYTTKMIVTVISRNTNYHYFFFGCDEYPKYFKRLFDIFKINSIYEILPSLIHPDILFESYDSYINLFYFSNRLYYKDNSSFLERLISEEEFDDLVKSFTSQSHYESLKKEFIEFILDTNNSTLDRYIDLYIEKINDTDDSHYEENCRCYGDECKCINLSY